MALFEMKSLSQRDTLENVKEDYRTAKRFEQFRFSEQAVYFPAFPGDQYLPYTALRHVLSKNTAISVKGTCGKQLPMVRLRLYYDEEFYKDLMFEKQKNVDKALEVIAAARPELSIDRDITPFGA